MKRWVKRYAAGCGLLLALASGSSAALEEGVELQVGTSRAPGQSGTGAVFVEAVQDAGPVGDSGWNLGVTGTVGRLDGRGTPGYRASVVLVGFGGRLQHKDSPWFVELQAATPVGRTESIGGALEFLSAVGVSGVRWGILLRHASNAGLSRNNAGETMLLASYRF